MVFLHRAVELWFRIVSPLGGLLFGVVFVLWGLGMLPGRNERAVAQPEFVTLGAVLLALALTGLILANTKRARRAWRTSLGVVPEDDAEERVP
ncbi:hypothetical protein [Leifsonia sp. 1010]|uniref:hypothetical protein n=1 Tax=Leifsonia sp. 1010 TaxID=2817769 RepID=UPI002861FFEB|nr:hypothetical protein [Leifsonia sp. 1010]MDR6612891.1 hypothetical protein [Leifsonia sp. 1010]